LIGDRWTWFISTTTWHQNSLMISPEFGAATCAHTTRPGDLRTRGPQVMYHCDGHLSAHPELIDLGIDLLNPSPDA